MDENLTILMDTYTPASGSTLIFVINTWILSVPIGNVYNDICCLLIMILRRRKGDFNHFMNGNQFILLFSLYGHFCDLQYLTSSDSDSLLTNSTFNTVTGDFGFQKEFVIPFIKSWHSLSSRGHSCSKSNVKYKRNKFYKYTA